MSARVADRQTAPYVPRLTSQSMSWNTDTSGRMYCKTSHLRLLNVGSPATLDQKILLFPDSIRARYHVDSVNGDMKMATSSVLTREGTLL